MYAQMCVCVHIYNMIHDISIYIRISISIVVILIIGFIVIISSSIIIIMNIINIYIWTWERCRKVYQGKILISGHQSFC